MRVVVWLTVQQKIYFKLGGLEAFERAPDIDQSLEKKKLEYIYSVVLLMEKWG